MDFCEYLAVFFSSPCLFGVLEVDFCKLLLGDRRFPPFSHLLSRRMEMSGDGDGGSCKSFNNSKILVLFTKIAWGHRVISSILSRIQA